MGLWHRYVQWRARGRDTMSGDAGLSLIEILVAIVLLSGALIGTAGEVATYVKQQTLEKAQVTANRLANAWFEYAESLERNATLETVGAATTTLTPITNPNPNPATTTVGGVTYSELTSTHICTAAQIKAGTPLSSCTGTGSPGPSDTIYGTITVTWSLGTQTHKLTMTRNLADNSAYQPADTNDPGGNALSNCTRKGTVTSSTLSISPATQKIYTASPVAGRAYVDGGSGNPTKDAAGNSISASGLTISLVETGLVNSTDGTQTGAFGPATCVPLLWTDSVGTHYVDMHTTPSVSGVCPVNSSNYTTQSCTYTASIANTDVKVTGLATPTFDGTVPFCAYLSGTGSCTASMTDVANTSSVATKGFYVNAAPSVQGCSVNGGGGILTRDGHPVNLLGQSISITVQCTNVVNLATTDTLTVSWPTGQGGGNATGTATLTWVSGTGSTTWRGSVGSGQAKIKTASVLSGGSNNTWTFTANRASDHEPAPVIAGQNTVTNNASGS